MVTEAGEAASSFTADTVWRESLSTDEAGRLTVDLGAIADNYSHICAMHPTARVGAVLKADGYGLGAAHIAPVLAKQGCGEFFVAHLAEALALKPHLPPSACLYVLNGLAPGDEACCAAEGIIPVLNTPHQARAWYALALAQSRTLPAALQVDTGMSRLGLDERELEDVLGWPEFAQLIDIRVLMSHLACADLPATAANASQMLRFALSGARLASVPKSLANSAAALGLPEAGGDLLRPGLVLYGVDPGTGMPPQMRAAIRLDARIIQIRDISAGAAVGYGHDYVADTPRRIATLSVGYADGWSRGLSGKGAAWHAGRRLPILGRISMDTCVVDVTGLPEGCGRPGDLVELIGPHQSVEDLAGLLDTTPHEILTSLGGRFMRVYVDGTAPHAKDAIS